MTPKEIVKLIQKKNEIPKQIDLPTQDSSSVGGGSITKKNKKKFKQLKNNKKTRKKMRGGSNNERPTEEKKLFDNIKNDDNTTNIKDYLTKCFDAETITLPSEKIFKLGGKHDYQFITNLICLILSRNKKFPTLSYDKKYMRHFSNFMSIEIYNSLFAYIAEVKYVNAKGKKKSRIIYKNEKIEFQDTKDYTITCNEPAKITFPPPQHGNENTFTDKTNKTITITKNAGAPPKTIEITITMTSVPMEEPATEPVTVTNTKKPLPAHTITFTFFDGDDADGTEKQEQIEVTESNFSKNPFDIGDITKKKFRITIVNNDDDESALDFAHEYYESIKSGNTGKEINLQPQTLIEGAANSIVFTLKNDYIFTQPRVLTVTVNKTTEQGPPPVQVQEEETNWANRFKIFVNAQIINPINNGIKLTFLNGELTEIENKNPKAVAGEFTRHAYYLGHHSPVEVGVNLDKFKRQYDGIDGIDGEVLRAFIIDEYTDGTNKYDIYLPPYIPFRHILTYYTNPDSDSNFKKNFLKTIHHIYINQENSTDIVSKKKKKITEKKQYNKKEKYFSIPFLHGLMSKEGRENVKDKDKKEIIAHIFFEIHNIHNIYKLIHIFLKKTQAEKNQYKTHEQNLTNIYTKFYKGLTSQAAIDGNDLIVSIENTEHTFNDASHSIENIKIIKIIRKTPVDPNYLTITERFSSIFDSEKDLNDGITDSEKSVFIGKFLEILLYGNKKRDSLFTAIP